MARLGPVSLRCAQRTHACTPQASAPVLDRGVYLEDDHVAHRHLEGRVLAHGRHGEGLVGLARVRGEHLAALGAILGAPRADAAVDHDGLRARVGARASLGGRALLAGTGWVDVYRVAARLRAVRRALCPGLRPRHAARDSCQAPLRLAHALHPLPSAPRPTIALVRAHIRTRTGVRDYLQSTFGLVAIMSVVDGSVVSCSDTCAAAPCPPARTPCQHSSADCHRRSRCGPPCCPCIGEPCARPVVVAADGARTWSIAAATRRTTRGALPADMNPKAVAEPSSASDALALRPGDDEDFVVEDDEDGGDDEDGEGAGVDEDGEGAGAGGEGELPAARAMLQRPSAMQAHRHARAAVGAIG